MFLRKLNKNFFIKYAYFSTSKSIVSKKYDVIVIGGGHAGCEAAAASARTGANTLLITHKLSTIGTCSCNPAIGGIGKGNLVKEIDALDGLMAKVADKSGISFRILNQSKGPAVHGPRAQIDRDLYLKHMQEYIFNYDNLDVLENSIEDLIIDNKTKIPQVTGVLLEHKIDTIEKPKIYSNKYNYNYWNFFRWYITLWT